MQTSHSSRENKSGEQCHRWAVIRNGTLAYILIVVRNHLYVTYPGRWLKHGGFVAWSPHSPDHNPLGFFVWGHLKSSMCVTPEAKVEDHMTRIVVASADFPSTPELFESDRPFFVHWCRLCCDLCCCNFEQLL
ncbi:uncharacterized protein TNCV_1730141 [Trichonephila clavipes]|nr:uncharacterized protein TNCV_1730141 [Trichonephila clavipes]